VANALKREDGFLSWMQSLNRVETRKDGIFGRVGDGPPEKGGAKKGKV